MQVIKKGDGDSIYLKFRGNFTYADKDLLSEFVHAFSKSGIKNMELDFEEVESMDSSGLGVLLIMQEDADANDGCLVFSHIKGEIKTLFKQANLYKMFTIK